MVAWGPHESSFDGCGDHCIFFSGFIANSNDLHNVVLVHQSVR